MNKQKFENDSPIDQSGDDLSILLSTATNVAVDAERRRDGRLDAQTLFVFGAKVQR